jgi:hypothetical protein
MGRAEERSPFAGSLRASPEHRRMGVPRIYTRISQINPNGNIVIHWMVCGPELGVRHIASSVLIWPQEADWGS